MRLGRVAARGRTAPVAMVHRAAPCHNAPVTFTLALMRCNVASSIALMGALVAAVGAFAQGAESAQTCPPPPTVRQAASGPMVQRPTSIVQEVHVTCGANPMTAASPSLAASAPISPAPDYWARVSRLLEAFAKLLGSVAWPAAAVLVAYHFKTELASLLARLKRVKAGAAEAEFERRVDEAEEAVAMEGAVVEPPVGPAARSAAAADPRGSILGAWLEVEKAIFDLVEARNLSLPSSRPTKGVVPAMRAIQKAQLIDPSFVALFHDLRPLRNDAAHTLEFNPEPAAVIRFTQLASALTQALRTAANEG